MTGRAPVVMRQKWRDLLFLHWRYPPDLVQPMLPPGLEVETFDGSAWVGVVPFRMRAIRPRFLPALPHLSYFLEANVRTYARDAQGRSGVWFHSLDANRRLAVGAARRFFSLPYFRARMRCRRDGTWLDYRTHRVGSAEVVDFRYGPGEALAPAAPDSLEHFLVERYRLWAWQARQRRLLTGEVEHPPYPLHAARVDRADRGLLTLAGYPDPDRPADHAVFSPGVDVRVRRVEQA